MKTPQGPAHRYKRRRRHPGARVKAPLHPPFPPDFVWGAASASHQVEGGDVHSDWWRYERLPGTVRNFSSFPPRAAELKSDHWARFPEDIQRMADELGLNGYRFSIDWSRVEPREGEFDQAVIARYAELCGTLRARGIRPCVTLFHWSSPDWIWDHDHEEETGWYDPRIVDRFESFCAQVVPALAPHVDLFCTLNEPNIFMYGAFSEGILCPGHKRHDDDLLPVARNLLEAHLRAYRVIKASRPDAAVGIAHSFGVFEPESHARPLEALVAAMVEQGFTWTFPDAIATGELVFTTRKRRVHRLSLPGLRGTLDFLGVNYYERNFVRIPPGWRLRGLEILHDHAEDKEIWPKEIYTAGFLEVLETAWRRYGIPLYVTENGRAHPDDRQREAFLREHVLTLAAALDRGIDVRGYFWWSLLDNQEWAHGFVPRLGLYEVDYETGQRRLRGTGRAYAEIIRRGGRIG